MDGMKDLETLIKSMSPELSEENFVFVSCPSKSLPSDLSPICLFQEEEGTTLICRANEAKQLSLSYTGVWKRITLRVHSALDAVGFLNEITAALAEAGISCNVVSAYYHDHLFVPELDAEKAMNTLRVLSQRHPNPTPRD
ncbi:ACT domain-containing protein [Pelagicoccus mobilis]|uniref:ACT domain-containing protein n=1 Tax=Pelagicoccus mobilis TaxID=415221 RepID=A0A934RYM9_9BACT|nr:ACT domain-containing protein [Pelagicoccus mobilis]MBK1878758.1 ACT domain-containing protein [Pelagicoccus mobilis]